MDTGVFSFVLWTAALGMAVVFAFLVLLSLLMKTISAVDRLAVGSSTRTPAVASTASADASVPSDSPEATPPSWVVAAAVAYIELEHAPERTSAAAWTARIAR